MGERRLHIMAGASHPGGAVVDDDGNVVRGVQHVSIEMGVLSRPTAVVTTLAPEVDVEVLGRLTADPSRLAMMLRKTDLAMRGIAQRHIIAEWQHVSQAEQERYLALAAAALEFVTAFNVDPDRPQ